MTRPRQTGSMAVTITPLESGKFHVALDWRPNETGVFTKEELLATGMKMLAVAEAEHTCPQCEYTYSFRWPK